jgi:hypothetical protein
MTIPPISVIRAVFMVFLLSPPDKSLAAGAYAQPEKA